MTASISPEFRSILSSLGSFGGPGPDGITIALIGTYAPRKCGIATFARDIVEKLAEFHPEIRVDVHAVNDPACSLSYESIAGTIRQDDAESYREAARSINDSGVDAVWLQHEYGIFGGECGAYVCELVDRIAAPLILTPHTVLGEPSRLQREILERLVSRASRIMLMSRYSRDLLAEQYGAPHEIIRIIEHGGPDRPFGRQEQFKERLGLSGRHVLTTFGLLGPGKGIERAIEALPAILERHPDTLYRIVGQTHPNLLAREGESYRERLKALAEELGVSHQVVWENRFLETEELLDQLEACDIYITPYPNLQQSTSGTLSYAVALGKAVVSTPYLHARELLDGGVGRLIEPNSSQAIAQAVCDLLDSPSKLGAMQRRAYAKGRERIWPRFADAAARLITESVAPPPRPAPLGQAPGLSALFAMSDGTGVFQHAKGIVPDRDHGYCLDDNARALMLVNVAAGLTPEERTRWSMLYGSFVQHAWNEQAGRFRNFMRFDRSWCEEAGSEDSNGRAFWALGQTIERSPDKAIREWATFWYDTALPHLRTLQSPRAAAFAALGACARLRAHPDHGASRDFVATAAAFLLHELQAARRPGWVWFEEVLGYDNPRLSQALIEPGMALEQPGWVTAGLETLAWITRQQTAAQDHFRPIGSESLGQAHAGLPFDQQPLEAQAAIEAAQSAWRATGDDRWVSHALAAWRWFFGRNDRGAVLADLASGRCRDGLIPRGSNENCGAESILAFQLACYSMLALTQSHASTGETIEQGPRSPKQSPAYS